MQGTQETWVGSLSWEDRPRGGNAIHSGILGWEIPWTEEPGRLQSMGLQRAGHDLVSEHMHERYNFWKTKNMCFARVDKTFSFCLGICGLWSMVLSFFFFGTISVVPNIQQGWRVWLSFDCWFLNRFFSIKSKVLFVVSQGYGRLQRSSSISSYSFLGGLSLAFCSSDSPNPHRCILQAGFCATLYQMYYIAVVILDIHQLHCFHL